LTTWEENLAAMAHTKSVKLAQRETRLKHAVPWWLALAAIVACCCVRTLHGAESAPLDPQVVQEHVQALAKTHRRRDENPYGWLLQRREQIIPQLIAGLDSCDDHTALMCLRILDQATPRPEIRDTLIRIAQDGQHHLNAWATGSLRWYADDAQVRKLLESAYAQKDRLPPYHRAMVALGLGRPQEAGQLLLAQLTDWGGGAARHTIVRQLGEIGSTTHILGLKGALAKLATDSESRRIYVAARLALADVAPAEHPLTEDERTFLNGLAQAERLSESEQERVWRKLARLEREETRPLVMRILATRSPEPALTILRTWRDTAALPEIERLIRAGSTIHPYVSVYLEITDTDGAVDRLAELVADRKSRHQVSALRAGMKSEIPAERKLRLARLVRKQLGPERARSVARTLAHAGPDAGRLLVPLMAEESELEALSIYSEFATQHRSEAVETQLRRAHGNAGAGPAASHVAYGLVHDQGRKDDPEAHSERSQVPDGEPGTLLPPDKTNGEGQAD